MRGGITSFICSSCLIVTGCTTTTQTAAVKIRPIPDAAAKLRTGSGVLAEANGQLALGNVGLALEGFRKALREQPNSPEAYAGIAKCYEAMGRYDLARSNYEAALALTPKDPKLLTAVAVAFDQQGQTSAAQEARDDAAAARPEPVPQLPAPRLDSTARVALGSSVTVQLPPASPVTSHIVADLSPREPVVQRIAAAPVVSLPGPRTEQRAAVAIGSTQAVQSFASSSGLLTALASNVPLDLSPPEPASVQRVASAPEISLPEPRTEQRATVALGSTHEVHSSFASSAGLLRALASSLGVELPQPGPRLRADREDQAVATVVEPARGPYLERLSPGEVALVTDGRPAWRAQLVAQTRTSATVRWVPIMTAEVRPNIQILNAAQRQGLAAKTRTVLLDRGWRKIQIGNAGDVRERSVVIYLASRRTLGRSLAAQFGFPSQSQGESGVLVVLLGRDAARPIASATRG